MSIEMDPKLCFALMPMEDPFIEVYEEVVKPTVEATGLNCLYAGEIFGANMIMEDIWDRIERARVIIADLTGRNPNVFCEVGYGHSLDKGKVILIAQTMHDVPFDLQGFRCVVYSLGPRGLKQLRHNLEGQLQAVQVQEPQSIRVVTMKVGPSGSTKSSGEEKKAASIQPVDVTLLRDAGSGILYLMDVTGKAREIPDDRTSSFLEHALGIWAEARDFSSAEIAKLRGEKLPSVRDWKRPLTPQEEAKEKMRSRAQQSLDIEATFEEVSRPQSIKLTITNQGSRPMCVKKISFQHHELPRTALTSHHPRDGVAYSIVPFSQTALDLAPGDHLRAELQLAQTWLRADIERYKGRWGFLLVDVVWEGELVEGLLFPV